jgi:MYXO-CTERM domain-containing protein
MQKLFISLAFIAGSVPSLAAAQTPYVVGAAQGTYAPISGGTTHVPVAYDFFNQWDEGSAAIPLPFNFTWYGVDYTTIHAFTNGLVSFDPPGSNIGVVSPPSQVPSNFDDLNNYIAPMWGDLNGPQSAPVAAIRTLTTGGAGNRVFTIQYENFVAFSNPTSSVNFQVQLFEATDQVQVNYGPNSGIINASSVMENATGDEGQSLLTTCAPANCSSLEWPSGLTVTIALPSGPELVGSLTVPNGGYPGTNFGVDVSIRNVGLQATPAFDYQLLFSASNTNLTGATVLGTYTQPAIPASAGVNTTRTVTVPAVPVGTYYVVLVIDVDNDVVESLETNNTIYSTPFTTGPDLRGTLAAPAQSGPGEPLDVNFSLLSSGAPVVAPIAVTFYLSTDNVQDAQDTPLGTQNFTLPDGFTFSGTVNLTVPANQAPSPPVFYVLAVLDSGTDIDETDEANNLVVSSSSVLIEGPDLEIPSITAGPFGFRGLPYPVSTSIQNVGGATARNFTLCVFLSDNLLISVVSDLRIAEIPNLTLAPGEIQRVELQPVIQANTSTGSWYVAAVVDCDTTVLEANEQNNIRRRNDPITVRDPAPDFTPLEISTASAAAAGENTPVSVRIANLGNLAGPTHVRLVVSTDLVFDGSDRTIYETTTPLTLTPPGEQTLAAWGEVPGDLPSGAYYLGAIVDPSGVVDEVYEDNNTIGRGPVLITGADLAIVSPNPPNPIIGAPYVVRFHAIGGSAAYTFSLTWAPGQQPVGLSFDPATAELSGTPTPADEGRHQFTLRVTSGNLTASKDFSVLITPPTLPLTIVSSRLPPAVAMEPYSLLLVAVGGVPPYRWSTNRPGPPAGLALSADGELAGQPQLVGAATFRVTCTDLEGTVVNADVAIDIVDPSASISIMPADIASAEVGTPYVLTFVAMGGLAPYRWRLDGSIPGLSFDPALASLTGTPTVAGTYPITVEVRDVDGLLDRNAYLLEVLEAGELRIATGQSADTALPNGQVGVPYTAKDGSSVRLRAIPSDGVRWSLVDGGLPAGLTLDLDSGLIQGTPTIEGVYPFIVLARNPANDLRRATLVIVVDPPEDTTGTNPPDDGCSCRSHNSERGGFGAALALLGAGWWMRRRRGAAGLLLLLVLSWSGTARAQVVPYQIFTTTEPYVGLGSGASALSPGLGDGNTAQISLPFSVYLYGETGDTLYVNANGLVGISNVGVGNHNPPQINPSGATPNGFFAPLWDDWCASPDFACQGNPNMGVFYSIDSTPGAGQVSIEFRHLTHFIDDTPPTDATFMITLYEGQASQVEFHYGPITPGLDFTGSPISLAARIGLESLNGQYGMWVAPCGNVSSGCSASQVEALANTKITLVADAGEDVAAGAVSLPSVAYPGLPMAISARAISRHQNPLGPVRYAAYLVAASATSTTAGRLIYEGGPLTLQPFESRQLNFDGEIPSDVPAGQYRVLFFIDSDDVLDETVENNNIASSVQSVRIADRAPDFKVTRILPLAEQVSPGDSLRVAYRFENGGNEPGELIAQLYLSENQAITLADQPLGGPQNFPLESRQVVTGTLAATVPAGIQTGTYYVGAIVDPTLQVPELSDNNNVGRSAATITVVSDQVAIITQSLAPATLDRAYEATLAAAGGDGRFSYRLASGTLPRGLSFRASDATIRGTPTELGDFPLEFQVTSGVLSATRTLSLAVVDPAFGLTVVTRTLPTGFLGDDYAVQLQGTGGRPPYSWRVSNGSLPPGFVLSEGGQIYGAPVESGFRAFAVQLRDDNSTTASVSLGLEVRGPTNLTIVPVELPDARAGEPYAKELRALGGIGTITWAALTDLPPGLSLAASGAIGGLAEKVGTFSFTLEALDSRGNRDTATFVLKVTSSGRFAIQAATLPVGQPNTDFRVLLKAEGGRPPYTWEIVRGEGFLPPDFTAEPSPGVAEGESSDDFIIKGRLTQEGTWAFTVRVYDQQARSDQQAFAIVSRIPPPPPPAIEEGCQCRSTQTGSGSFLGLFALAGLWAVRKRRIFLGMLLFLGWSSPAQAQVPYFLNQYPLPYTPLVGGTTITPSSPDDGIAQVPIGFNFEFYGVVYDTVTVGVNGALTFAQSCTTSAQCGFNACTLNRCEGFISTGPSFFPPETAIPNPNEPNRMVAAFWDDLYLEPTSSLSSAVLGTAPNREFVVQWSGIRRYPSGSGTSNANFQIRLSEGSGAIRVHYGTAVSGTNNSAFNGSLGIENADGTVGLPGLPCGGIDTCTFTELTSLANTVLEYVGPLGAELVVSGLAPTGGEVGTTVSVDVTARNIGLMPSGVAFPVRVYFSTDATIDSNDTLLGTLNFAALAAQTAATQSLNFVVPSVAPGYYTIGGIIDPANVVTEDIETNNAAAFRTDFLIGADLSVEVDSPPASGPGEVVQVPVTLLNFGSAQPAVLVRLYFSRDNVFDANDTLIGTATVAAPALPRTTLSLDATIPNILPGDYYTVAVVDANGAITEANETNNVAVSPMNSELTGPDLFATAAGTTAVFVFRGETFPVTGQMRNVGGATARGFYYGFYLSENQLINIFSDPSVADVGPVDLAPGVTENIALVATAPANLAPGTYYLGLALNTTGSVLEQFPNNNIARTTMTVIVRDPAPDFSATRIRLPATGAAGETLTVERVITNLGNAPGMIGYEVYLSTDANIDPASDLYLGQGQVSLSGGTEDADVDAVGIPSTVLPGSYYIGYILDPLQAVEELYEDNNRVASTGRVVIQPNQLQILTQSLPLATVDAAYEVILSASGGAGPLTWSATATVPPGLVLEDNGRLHGRPTTEGPFNFVVRVTDGSAQSEKAFTLLVASETLPLEVASASLLPGFVGRPYEFPVVAFGGVPPYRWSTSGDPLVRGITFDAEGRLSGTPTEVGLSNITFRVADAVGVFAEKRLVLRVVTGGNSVRLADDILPDGRLGEAYEEELRVAQATGASPFLFELAAGNLPPGLILEEARITGIPEAVGTFDFTIRVSDSRSDFDLNRYLITIEEGDGVTFVTTSLPVAVLNEPYLDEVDNTVRLKAVSVGTSGTINFSQIGGQLPPGLSLSADGSLSGTPTAAGIYSFTVLAVDGAGQFDVRAFGVVVQAPEQVLEQPFNDDGCSCRTGAQAPRSGFGLAGGLALLWWLRRRRTAKVVPFALALLLPVDALAQSGTYQVSTGSQTYQPRTGGTTLTFPTDDDDSVNIALPFPFRFFDQNFNSINASTNGYVTFSTDAGRYDNLSFPDTSAPDNMIAFFWDDWENTSVEWFIEGTAPDRVVIIQYSNGFNLGDASGGLPQVQVWLFEGQAARFEIHYGAPLNMTDPNLWSASIGYQDEGTAGGNLRPCTVNDCDGTELTALANTFIRVQQDGGTDVIAVAIGAPVDVYAGVPFSAPVTLASPHANPIGPFVYTVHLMASGETTPNHPIYTSEPITLAPYQELVTTATPSVPLGTPDGAYRLALVADSTNQVSEPNESNNVVFGRDEFRIGSPLPDFRVTSINSTPATANPGGRVSVYLDLNNAGNLAGSADWKLYLSRNTVISTDDLELDQGNVDLPLLSTTTATVQVDLPTDLVAGRYYFGAIIDPDNAVTELVEVNNTGVAATSLAVTAGGLGIATTSLPPAYVGQDYSLYLQGSGGDGVYTWRLATGTLPTGMTFLTSTGELRGRPTAAGTHTLEFEVASAGGTFRATFELLVAEIDGGLTIVTRQLLPGIIGASYPPAGPGTSPEQLQRLIAIGGAGPVTWTLNSPAPAGLTLASDGLLSGIPTQSGDYELAVSATDGTNTRSRTLRLTLAEPGRLTIVAVDLPNGRLGEDYNQLLTVVGRSQTTTVSFTSDGPLPPGLTLTTEGRLVGIPQRTGSWAFSVLAAESGNDGARDTAGFRLQIDADAGFGITPSSLSAATVGQAYTATLEARQGRAPFTWRVVGPPLPRGLTYEVVESGGADAQSLVFRGTPEEPGAVSLLVTLLDNDGRRAELPVTLLVNPIPAPPPVLEEEGGCTCRETRSSGRTSAWALLGLFGLLMGRRRIFSRPSGSARE